MNNIIAALIVGASIITTAQAVELERLTGHVTRIVDGDTIVLEAQGAKHRIRLAGTDAPERNQPWGEAATRELRRQVAGKDVQVDWRKQDHWKRLIGIVRLDGEDLNLHMIGREGSKYGIDDFVEIKYLCIGGIS